MAEEQVELVRNALVRMGFDEDQSIFLTDNQGLGTLSAYSFLTDKDVDNLGSVIRKPGGTIRRGTRDVPNPGFSVSYVALKNLKLMCFFIRFKERTSRTIGPNDADRLRAEWTCVRTRCVWSRR